jgi:hypothetical protein
VQRFADRLPLPQLRLDERRPIVVERQDDEEVGVR